MRYDNNLDDQTYFRCHGDYKPKNAESGDKFKVTARFKDKNGKVFNEINIDVTCGEVEKPYKITGLEARYVEDKSSPTGAIEISASYEKPLFGTAIMRLYEGENEIYSSSGSYLIHRYKSENLKDGQTYTITAKLFSNGKLEDQTSVTVTWGGAKPPGENQSGENQSEENQSGENKPEISHTAGPFEKVLAAPIEALAYMIEKCFGITPVNELIFNHDGAGKKVTEGVGPFTKEDWEEIVKWYTLAAGFMGVLMFLSFVVSGYRTIISPIANPSKQADVKSDLLYILMAVLITLSALLIFQILAGLNDGIVDFFYVATTSRLGHPPDPMASSTAYSGTLGGALVRLAFIGVQFYLNFLYIIRKFVLAAILILTPFFAFSWATGRNSQAIGVWIGELTSNVFMQAAHAVVLSLYFTMFAQQNDGRFWMPIVALSALIPIAEVVRNLLQGYLKWLGVPEERWAGKVFGAMTGLGAVAGLIGLGAASLRSGAVKAAGMIGSTGGLPGASGGPGIPGGVVASGGFPGMAGGPTAPGMSGGSGIPGMSGGTGTSGGSSGVPSGWRESPSGLILPSEHVDAGSTAPQGPEAPIEPPMPSLESTAHQGHMAGINPANIAQNVGHAVGQMSMPGMGGFLGGVMSATAGSVTRTAATAYHAFKGYREVKQRLGEGATFGDAMKQFAGTDSVHKAVMKTVGTVALSSFGAGHWAAKRSHAYSRSITA